MAGLGIALLGAGSVIAISRTTGPRPARAHRGEARAIAPPPAEAPPGEVAGGPPGPAALPPVPTTARMPAPGSPAPATGPSGETSAAAPAPATHTRSRAKRRLFRAKQLREQLPARRDGGPGRIGGLRVPPEEGVARGAQEIDGSRLEPTTEGGVAPESGPADEENR